MTNKALKIAMIESDIPSQRQLARAAKIQESTLSLIVNGRYNPDSLQQAKIAAVVNRSPGEIFPQS